jgi:MipA family protein
MRFTPRFPLVSCLAFGLVLTLTAAHADEQPHGGPEARWGLGLGVSSKTSPYQGVDTKTTILPMVSYENRYVRVLGPSLEVKLPSSGSVSTALLVRYSDQGYKASDAIELQGMDERKGGLWLGARADWRLPWVQLGAEWLGDANGRSEGQQIKLEASRHVPIGALHFKPRLALVWQDRSFVDYYYGVKATESREARASYAGSDTVSTELGLQMNLPLAPGQSIFLDLSHTFLGSAIKNSPLVGRNGVSAARMAYVYRF